MLFEQLALCSPQRLLACRDVADSHRQDDLADAVFILTLHGEMVVGSLNCHNRAVGWMNAAASVNHPSIQQADMPSTAFDPRCCVVNGSLVERFPRGER